MGKVQQRKRHSTSRGRLPLENATGGQSLEFSGIYKYGRKRALTRCVEERCSPRQTSRVGRRKAEVEPLSISGNSGEQKRLAYKNN